MVNNLNYNTICTVIESWERLRRIGNYEEISGKKLFQGLFKRCPQTKTLFGFPIDMDPYSDEMLNSIQFKTHSKYLIRMLDKSMDLLGPDIDILTEILDDLGKKHLKHGVKKEYFSIMGESLLETLESTLNEFTEEDQWAWREVYDSLSDSIIGAMTAEKIVIVSWEKLKQVEKYQQVAGAVLFQRFFELCPESKTLFGFPIEMDLNSDNMLGSKRFLMHSTYFIQMLDQALTMMEGKELSDNMAQLGKSHARYGVEPEFFPLMGEALFYTMRETLKEDFTPECEAAWKKVYKKISTQLVKEMKQHR